MSKRKVMIVDLIAVLIKRMWSERPRLKKSLCFPKPNEPFGGDIDVKVDLSNHARKSDLKNTTWIDTTKLAAKVYLVSSKTEVDKLDIDELVQISVYLRKLPS